MFVRIQNFCPFLAFTSFSCLCINYCIIKYWYSEINLFFSSQFTKFCCLQQIYLDSQRLLCELKDFFQSSIMISKESDNCLYFCWELYFNGEIKFAYKIRERAKTLKVVLGTNFNYKAPLIDNFIKYFWKLKQFEGVCLLFMVFVVFDWAREQKNALILLASINLKISQLIKSV